MSSTREFVEQVYGKLTDWLDDMTTLTVETWTNTAGQDPQVRASTIINIDGDTRNTVPLDKDGNVDEKLLAMHQKTVEQARAERQALMKTVMGVVNGWLGADKVDND